MQHTKTQKKHYIFFFFKLKGFSYIPIGIEHGHVFIHSSVYCDNIKTILSSDLNYYPTEYALPYFK